MLEQRVALVTGAGRNIGREIALGLVAAGHAVAVNVRASTHEGQAVVDEITAAGGVAMLCAADVGDGAAVRAMVDAIAARWGRIDVLVNNAAVLISHEMFVETNPQDCDKEIKVVLYGTMNCARAVLPGMVERKFGKVINIVTDAARVGQERQCNYSAAKGGVISFTKSIAREVGRNNINVNAISPGATNSPMRLGMLRELTEKIGAEKAAEREEKVKRAYALRRIGEPEDIANAVVFLSSEASRHITGQILSVNGGFAMVG